MSSFVYLTESVLLESRLSALIVAFPCAVVRNVNNHNHPQLAFTSCPFPLRCSCATAVSAAFLHFLTCFVRVVWAKKELRAVPPLFLRPSRLCVAVNDCHLAVHAMLIYDGCWCGSDTQSVMVVVLCGVPLWRCRAAVTVSVSECCDGLVYGASVHRVPCAVC